MIPPGMNSYVQFVMIILFTDDVLRKILRICFDDMNMVKKDKDVQQLRHSWVQWLRFNGFIEFLGNVMHYFNVLIVGFGKLVVCMHYYYQVLRGDDIKPYQKRTFSFSAICKFYLF